MSVGLAATPHAGAVLAFPARTGFALAPVLDLRSKHSLLPLDGFAGHRDDRKPEAGAGPKYGTDIFK